jgi:outer membrane protein TolC
LISKGQKSADIANSEFDATRHRALTQQWAFLPSVSASASRTRASGSYYGNQTSTSREFGVDVTMNVFRFGADVAGREAAREAVRGAGMAAKLAELTGELTAARALCDAIGARLESKVYLKRMTVARQLVAAAEARFKRGILSEQEFAKLTLESASLEMAHRAAERKSERTTAIVRSYGGDIDANVVWPLAVDAAAFQRAMDWINKARPADTRIKVLEADANAARSSVTAARSAMLPSLDLAYGWSKVGPADGDELTDKNHVVMTLTVPVFSRFSEYGEYKARVDQSNAASARFEAERAVSDAQFAAAVREALAGLEDAKSRQEHIAVADRLYHDNLRRFERGLISVNELSIDEHRVREAELSAIDAWALAHVALFRLGELSGDSVLSQSWMR